MFSTAVWHEVRSQELSSERKTGMKGIWRKSVRWLEVRDWTPRTGTPRNDSSTGEQLQTVPTAFVKTWMQIPQNGEKPHKLNEIYLTVRLITTIYWAATVCLAQYKYYFLSLQNPLRKILQTYIHFHSNFMARCVAEFSIFSALENRK